MAEEFQAAVYGGNWWMSPRTPFNHSSCSSENLGPFWPNNLMDMYSKSINESSNGSMIFQDIQKLTGGSIYGNQNLLSRVQEEMNTFSASGDDGSVAEIEAEHHVFNVDQQQSLNFDDCTPYGYPLSFVESLFLNNSPLSSPPPLPPPISQQPLYNYQPNLKNFSSFTGNLTDNTAFKRPRLETPSPLPTFKVRKEKLGDRITAIQQLVSPFGKTDTASVLHEAIEYINLLHDQVNILSAPYMNGATKQLQPNYDKVKDEEPHKQDLKSQGLCLVPVSDMFPVTTEMAAGLWTPNYDCSFN